MKLLLILGFVVLCNARSEFELTLEELFKDSSDSNAEIFKTDIGPFFDKAVMKISEWLVSNQKDPLITPDVHKEFTKEKAGVKWHGKLDLTNGVTTGLSKIKRNLDAVLSYKDSLVLMTIPVAFIEITLKYDYSAEFMSIHAKGGVEASVKNLQLQVDILVDTVSTNLTLQEFKITDIGNTSIKFTGHRAIDWFMRLIADVAIALMQDSVRESVEQNVKELINKQFDDINKWPIKDPFILL